jgi:hypothetical protein
MDYEWCDLPGIQRRISQSSKSHEEKPSPAKRQASMIATQPAAAKPPAPASFNAASAKNESATATDPVTAINRRIEKFSTTPRVRVRRRAVRKTREPSPCRPAEDADEQVIPTPAGTTVASLRMNDDLMASVMLWTGPVVGPARSRGRISWLNEIRARELLRSGGILPAHRLPGGVYPGVHFRAGAGGASDATIVACRAINCQVPLPSFQMFV